MSYEVVRGGDFPILFKKDRLEFRSDCGLTGHEFMPGITLLGSYARHNKSYPVECFQYHKEGLDGVLEKTGRLIIRSGFGRGVHFGHQGQDPALYVVGVDIARVDLVTGEIVDWAVDDGDFVKPKHFSLDCFVGGVRGDNPVLANPV